VNEALGWMVESEIEGKLTQYLKSLKTLYEEQVGFDNSDNKKLGASRYQQARVFLHHKSTS